MSVKEATYTHKGKLLETGRQVLLRETKECWFDYQDKRYNKNTGNGAVNTLDLCSVEQMNLPVVRCAK